MALSTDKTRKSPSSVRAAKAAERRARIVEAALAEFSENGFAAARIEDIAQRADVAKGTIYLHFADKQALFAGIVRHAITPVVATLLDRGPGPGEPVRDYLLRIVPQFLATLREPPRGDVIRLLVAEGPRFPDLARIYFDEVVSRSMSRLSDLGRRAAGDGDAGGALLAEMPQLLVAPALLSVMWDGLFGRIQPLDGDALVRGQIGLLLGGEGSDRHF